MLVMGWMCPKEKLKLVKLAHINLVIYTPIFIIFYIGKNRKDHAVNGKITFPFTAWSFSRAPLSIVVYTKKGVYLL